MTQAAWKPASCHLLSPRHVNAMLYKRSRPARHFLHDDLTTFLREKLGKLSCNIHCMGGSYCRPNGVSDLGDSVEATILDGLKSLSSVWSVFHRIRGPLRPGKPYPQTSSCSCPLLAIPASILASLGSLEKLIMRFKKEKLRLQGLFVPRIGACPCAAPFPARQVETWKPIPHSHHSPSDAEDNLMRALCKESSFFLFFFSFANTYYWIGKGERSCLGGRRSVAAKISTEWKSRSRDFNGVEWVFCFCGCAVLACHHLVFCHSAINRTKFWRNCVLRLRISGIMLPILVKGACPRCNP